MAHTLAGLPPRALAFIGLAFFLFAALDTTAKSLVLAGYAPLFVVWVRFVTHLLFGLLLLQPWKHPQCYVTHYAWQHIVRGLLLVVTTLCNFIALQYLQLAETITIFLTSPMIVALLAGPILGEWLGLRRWLAIMVGFVGVLIVIRPGSALFDWPVLFSLSATLTYSLYAITTRRMAAESSESLLMYSALVAAVALSPAVFVFGQWPGSTADFLRFGSMGVLGALGHWGLIQASKLAPASLLAPAVYTQLIWMTLFGWLFFAELPDAWTIIGGAVIVSSGLYLWIRERHINKLSYSTEHTD